jgi:hypothetical protein
MSEKFITAGVTILIAIVGVAVLALLVSKSSNTSAVLSASSGGFRDALCTALSPIGVKCGSANSLIPNVNSTITFPGL